MKPIKSRGMRWVENVACIEDRLWDFGWESSRKEPLDVNGRIALNVMLMKQSEWKGVKLVHLAQDRDK